MSVKTALSTIWEGIKELFRSAFRFVKKVIKGILNFFKEVVQYFKSLSLNPKTDIPFLTDAKTLKEKIKNAPVVDVDIFKDKEGIFEGVYREDEDQITDVRAVSADELDKKTQEVLSKAEDGIVALS